jgi:hypothetical protein
VRSDGVKARLPEDSPYLVHIRILRNHLITSKMRTTPLQGVHRPANGRYHAGRRGE